MLIDIGHKVVAMDKREYLRLEYISHSTQTPFLKLGPCLCGQEMLGVAEDREKEIDISLKMGFFPITTGLCCS